jgi:hypothetical protein
VVNAGLQLVATKFFRKLETGRSRLRNFVEHPKSNLAILGKNAVSQFGTPIALYLDIGDVLTGQRRMVNNVRSERAIEF